MRDEIKTRVELATEPTILALTLPRYVPCVVKETPLAVWYDCQEDQYAVVCPECHRLITYHTLRALRLAIVSSERQCCQGCRAKITLEQNPGLIGIVLDFWYRKDAFPQSPNWVEAIPRRLCDMWVKEIEAGLDAATAPMMYVPSAPVEVAVDCV